MRRASASRRIHIPCRRTSTQVILAIAVIAFLCNSAVSHTDDGLPWEVTLGGASTLAIVFAAFYAKKTELALSMVRCGAPPQPAPPPHSPIQLGNAT